MKIRTRIALVLAASLIVAGSLALLVNAIAFQHVSYVTWSSYRDTMLQELGVSRDAALRSLDANPQLLFQAPGDVTRGPTGKTIDEASQAVQRRAVERTADQSRRWTVAALLAVTVGALTAGWFLAGRILRPIRLITRRAHAASALDLGARVALEGPNDEVKELADTFDEMLDRIALSFDGQRRFSAQVSHELRTPLAVTRSEVEMLLADADDTTLRTRLETIADANERAERLVSQLLVLARTDTRDLDRATFAFDELVGNVVGRAVEGPSWSGVRADVELRSTTVVGDRALLESLVRNLVDNAGRHNRRSGWVSIVVQPSPDGRRAVLDVSNSVAGGVGDSDDGAPGSAHIGLSIVAAVLDAHDGTIEWRRDPGAVTAHVELAATTDRAARALAAATIDDRVLNGT